MLMNNQVITWNGILYRVLCIYKEQVSLYPMESKDTGINVMVTTTEKLSEAEHNEEIVIQTDAYDKQRNQPVSGKSKEIADSNYHLIEPIVTEQDLLFDLKKLKAKIREMCADEETRGKERQIKRTLHNWWVKGQSLGALTPGYGNSNGLREYTNKPGRKSKISQVNGTPLNNEIREHFKKILRKYVLKENGDSLRRAYRIFLGEYKEKHPEVETYDAPTYAQLQYFYYKEFTIRERIQARTNPIHFAKDIKAYSGSSLDIVIGAGSIYTIDSTPADVTLVSEDDHTKIVGRPTLYVVRDIFTTMIAGITASFDPAMYKSAADVLYISMLNKVEYCRRFGIDITEDDWPASGIPACVVADNGELAGSQIDVFARANQVKITTTVSYRGDQKGIVEETFNALQKSVRFFLPGIPEKPGSKKSGYRENRQNAALTLKDYIKLLLLAAIDVNNHICRTIPKGLNAEIAATPGNLWKWSREQNLCQLRPVEDKKALRLMLLPRFPYTISRDGLCVQKIRYFCEEGANRGYFDRGIRDKRPTDMQIAIDPADVSRAWLFPEPEKEPYKYWDCTLASTSRHLEGMTLYEAELYIGTAAEAKAKAQMDTDLYGYKIRKAQEKLVRNALETKPKTTKSTKEQLKEIAKNRQEERVKQESANPRMQEFIDNNTTTLATVTEDNPVKKNFSYPQNFEDIPD